MSEIALADVRAACRWVTEQAENVRVRVDLLPEYAAGLASMPAFRPALDPRHHHLDRGPDTLAFVLCLDAVNFGSGWFPWLVERSGAGGYFTIAGALAEHFARRGPLTAAELAQISSGECADLFGQEGAPAPIGELMDRFAASWRQLGRHLMARFDGSFTTLVEAAAGSAERLVGLLAEMPGFADVSRYRERTVPFYKRAQLAVVDLRLAFAGEGWGRFEDLERLTIFADNQVPHVLRLDGVLEYEAELAERIDSGAEIEAGSTEEVEIRAATVHAAELLAAELTSLGVPTAAWELDQLLWNRGLEPRYEHAPAHRTRTIFY